MGGFYLFKDVNYNFGTINIKDGQLIVPKGSFSAYKEITISPETLKKLLLNQNSIEIMPIGPEKNDRTGTIPYTDLGVQSISSYSKNNKLYSDMSASSAVRKTGNANMTYYSTSALIGAYILKCQENYVDDSIISVISALNEVSQLTIMYLFVENIIDVNDLERITLTKTYSIKNYLLYLLDKAFVIDNEYGIFTYLFDGVNIKNGKCLLNNSIDSNLINLKKNFKIFTNRKYGISPSSLKTIVNRSSLYRHIEINTNTKINFSYTVLSMVDKQISYTCYKEVTTKIPVQTYVKQTIIQPIKTIVQSIVPSTYVSNKNNKKSGGLFGKITSFAKKVVNTVTDVITSLPIVKEVVKITNKVITQTVLGPIKYINKTTKVPYTKTVTVKVPKLDTVYIENGFNNVLYNGIICYFEHNPLSLLETHKKMSEVQEQMSMCVLNSICGRYIDSNNKISTGTYLASNRNASRTLINITDNNSKYLKYNSTDITQNTALKEYATQTVETNKHLRKYKFHILINTLKFDIISESRKSSIFTNIYDPLYQQEYNGHTTLFSTIPVVNIPTSTNFTNIDVSDISFSAFDNAKEDYIKTGIKKMVESINKIDIFDIGNYLFNTNYFEFDKNIIEFDIGTRYFTNAKWNDSINYNSEYGDSSDGTIKLKMLTNPKLNSLNISSLRFNHNGNIYNGAKAYIRAYTKLNWNKDYFKNIGPYQLETDDEKVFATNKIIKFLNELYNDCIKNSIVDNINIILLCHTLESYFMWLINPSYIDLDNTTLTSLDNNFDVTLNAIENQYIDHNDDIKTNIRLIYYRLSRLLYTVHVMNNQGEAFINANNPNSLRYKLNKQNPLTGYSKNIRSSAISLYQDYIENYIRLLDHKIYPEK